MGRLCCLVALAIFVGACKKPPPDPEKVFPVTTFELREFQPANAAALTGSAEPYRQEEVGFEVSGRILQVRDVGDDLVGRAYDEDGTVVQQGDEIGRLDDTRYRLAVNALEARVASVRKRLEAQQVEVASARSNLEREQSLLGKADANRKLANQNLAREKQLLASGAGTQQDVDNAQRNVESSASSYKAQEASVTSATITIELKDAEAAATAAHVTELEAELASAKRDLEDCRLRAPFNGRITRVFVARGAVVQPGQAVVQLTLMDPIKVAVAVAADVDRAVHWGDPITIRPQDPKDPTKRLDITARVYEKGEVADPATRTFRIDLMARNGRYQLTEQDPDKPLPVLEGLMPAVTRFAGGEGLFVPTNAILKDGGTYYVLRIPAVMKQAKRIAGRYKPVRSPVVPGDQYIAVSRFTFRSIRSEELVPGDAVVPDAKPEYEQGFIVGRYKWLIRPGDLVPVVLPLLTGPPGFYVPVDAVYAINDQLFVFSVEGERVKKIPVQAHESQGSMRRISGDGLAAGLKLVVKGVHLLGDNDKVVVVGQERAR